MLSAQIALFTASFLLLLLAMSVHEFAHGFIAYRLGDTTARDSGRLTINPLAHIDLFGTIILPFLLFVSTHGQFVFGAAKPVPVNFMALRNPKRDMIWIGLAGPCANIIFALLLKLIHPFFPPLPVINFIFIGLIEINVVLGIFNLIPIPPMDGSRVLMGLLPRKAAISYSYLEPFGFIIVLVLAYAGALDWLVWPAIKTVLYFLIPS